ncbi:FAD-dependent oxidoreductase [Paenibacillus qinlingensis]|uniref:Ribulose 1,5-bisphosphate synthetase/thiazole synthase n=1 Tax=Paenibacillus qinlingensis TaxID=1837343 RepID=A0ABU1NS29_9BACL|nr:FAD-dependent oxidoreductase [Paenibacillus qinlingensis]MDR6550287.1 ribulose 1,5-bisphosphate synthetase/thiazole synthase [Paenibacillus qinlingensis]
MHTYSFHRNIPIAEEYYDLVVAGGGPAGAAAAISAARQGAKVLLVEGTGCLGGMGTSGLVTAFDPMANGERMLVGGFMKEVVETLYRRSLLRPDIDPDSWRKHYHKWTAFQVEGYKLVLDEFAVDAGVEVRFFTKVVDAEANSVTGIVQGVVLHNIEGFTYVRAKTFIDSTGDAVLSELCDVTCVEAGRDTPGIMPATLASLFSNIDWGPTKGKSYEIQQEMLHIALRDGHFSQPDRHLPGMAKVNHTVGYLNGGHLFNLNALRCKDLSDGVMLGRRLAREYMDFYKKYVPGFEHIEHVTTASLIGIRESRRIVGEYELNVQDYFARRQFPDQIGLFNKSIDIHPYNNSEEEYKRYYDEFEKAGRLSPGECFGIPYGVLVPKGWRNLWVAGRCVSSDVQVHGSIRVQPACAMMGQAAGTAAVQTIRTGQSACELDTEQLITTLREHDAYLPQETLSKQMTR